MTDVVRLFVPGSPVPQGSLRATAFLVPCTSCHPGQPCGNARVCVQGRRATANTFHDGDKELQAWRNRIAAAARPMFSSPWSGPVDVRMIFAFHRPQNHRGTKGNLLAAGKARPRPTVPPDRDKLERGVLDALTGVAYVDDAQVVGGPPDKVYTSGPEGLYLQVKRAERLDAEADGLLRAFSHYQGEDGDVWPVGHGPLPQPSLLGTT